MTENTQIQCIKKTDRYSAHDRISHVGGGTPNRWKMTEPDAIRAIDEGTKRFYVSVGGHSVWVIIARSAAGHRYLKTDKRRGAAQQSAQPPECP